MTVAGRPVRLTATEYKLLFELSVHAGRVLTHDHLLARVWGTEYSGDSRLVRAFVKKLRRKLRDDADQPHLHIHRASRRLSDGKTCRFEGQSVEGGGGKGVWLTP